jgi:hypothetical protein
MLMKKIQKFDVIRCVRSEDKCYRQAMECEQEKVRRALKVYANKLETKVDVNYYRWNSAI